MYMAGNGSYPSAGLARASSAINLDGLAAAPWFRALGCHPIVPRNLSSTGPGGTDNTAAPTAVRALEENLVVSRDWRRIVQEMERAFKAVMVAAGSRHW